MVIFQVFLQVKPAAVAAFQAACADNARHSIQEPGCLRFEVYQEAEDATRFCLFEIYVDDAARQAHRTTEHYLRWKNGTADMIVERIVRNWQAVEPTHFAKP